MVPNLWERSTQSTQQKTLKCFNWRQSNNFAALCRLCLLLAVRCHLHSFRGGGMPGICGSSWVQDVRHLQDVKQHHFDQIEQKKSKKSDQNRSKPPPSPSGAAFCTGFLWERLQCCGPCSRVSFAHGGKAATKQEDTVPCLLNQERPFRDIQI